MIQLVCFIWGTDTILQQKSMKQKCYPNGLVGNQAEVVTSTLSRSKKGHPLAHPLFREWKLNRVICFLKQRSCSEVIWINCVAPLKVLRTKQIHSGDGFNLPGPWKVNLLTWDQRQPPVAQPAGPLMRAPTGPPCGGTDTGWLRALLRVSCARHGAARGQSSKGRESKHSGNWLWWREKKKNDFRTKCCAKLKSNKQRHVLVNLVRRLEAPITSNICGLRSNKGSHWLFWYKK